MKKSILLLLFLLISSSTYLLGQGKPYEGPDDPAGDIAALREGWMNGNRVLIYFKNSGLLGTWPNWDYSKWPNDYTGLGMIDNMRLIIGARVYVENDTITVDDISQIESRTDLDTIYFAQAPPYKNFLDRNPEGTVDWGFYPVFGYFNEASEYPAMSNQEDSWPLLGWPSRGDELKWPGEWDGRFGRGIKYADLESYFVFNDAQDQEYLGPEDSIKYYPRPGVKIGDKLQDVTIQKGMPWGGIGIRVNVRGYQWNNAQTRDAVFWEYDISNISDYNLPEMVFGYYLDNGIGQWGDMGSPDDLGYYDEYENMSYSWDYDGTGIAGEKPGILGIAYLETPGIPADNIDNDDDGLTDEARDNEAFQIIGPTDGISDLDKFMKWYGYVDVEQLREHWDADEDQDWDDGIDENGNGKYDPGEYAGDDVGIDGVGPNDLNYIGPDDGECNHKPDFLTGYGSEPDFGPTDVSESDMLGLTSFELFSHPGNRTPQVNFDEDAFFQLSTPKLIEWTGNIENLYETFGSGLFPLDQGRTERISMSELHSYEELSGLSSPTHDAPALFQKKRIVQFIYENDYRFAQPPLRPTLKATASDGKVILTWGDISDKLTREPLLGGKNDFEGYKLYKATDVYFSDAEKLRDMFGNPIGKKPIYQCDLKDNIKGAADFVHINGELYYLGEDSGIKHYFVDENVENGRTYYYGLVAYDYGFEGLEVSIMPSENNVVVDLDENENIRFIGKNVQVVVPHQKAAGYVDPSIIMLEEESNVHGSGEIIPKIFDINTVAPNHTYKIKFQVNELGNARKTKILRHPLDLVRVNSGFSVYDVTLGDSLLYEESIQYHSMNNILNDGEFKIEDAWVDLEDINYLNNQDEIYSDVFAGVQLQMNLNAFVGELSYEKSGWVVGKTEMNITPSIYESGGFPYQYDIIFTNDPAAHSTQITRESYVFGLNGSSGYVQGSSFILFEYLINQSFPFYVVNKLVVDSLGQYEPVDILVEDVNRNGEMDLLEDRFLVGHSHQVGNEVYWGGTIFGFDFHGLREESQLPKGGDVYRVDFDRPYWTADSIMFRVEGAEELNEEILKENMNAIKVVPNPYVVTNTMEPAVSNWQRNQRRQIMFTHIPAQSKISIFSVSGILIDEIDVDNAIGSRESDWDLNTSANGTVHWDLRSKEGLEIAAGYYIYRVESKVTGDVKVGKFAVIK